MSGWLTSPHDAAIAAMSRKGMRVLIIDLRGNPGGLLNVAVDIGGRFVDSGAIVSTRGRAHGQTRTYLAAGQARWRMPMYVLVDHDSASASDSASAGSARITQLVADIFTTLVVLVLVTILLLCFVPIVVLICAAILLILLQALDL